MLHVMDEFKINVLNRLYMLHASDYSDPMIRKNAGLDSDVDTVTWCKKQLKKKSITAELKGKNWHVQNKKYRIILHSVTLIIISVKRIKDK